MQMACACASASMAWSTLIDHSCSSIVLVMAWANVGPSASDCASAWARSPISSGPWRALKKPQAWASSPRITRPV